MSKIIATDLDGTLFYPKDKKEMIYKPNLFFLQSFIDNGGKLILISGRSYKYCQKVIKKIDRPTSVISYNGACVFNGEQVIFENVLDNKDAEELINDVGEEYKNPGVFLMTDKGLFVHLRSKSKLIRQIYIWYYKSQKIYAEDLHVGEDLFYEQLRNGKVHKFMLYFGLGKRNRNRASKLTKILRNMNDNIEANWSGNVVEITPKGCSKNVALKFLLENQGLSEKDLYVVGDSGNDISMFKQFHENSFCMGHSPKTVRKYAKYTIDKFEDLSRYIFEK
ncbi:MAG: HAD family phosphatase [Bacilli bacterium]|nr:HAD family phosphatase [Bacilli bacterium]